MNDFMVSFSNALRYVFPGFIAYAYIYITDYKIADKLISDFGVLGNILLILLGSIFYLLYRPFIYQGFIYRFQDILRCKSENYRTYLKKKYKVNTYEAMQLWVQIKRYFLKDHYSEAMQVTASGIHLLFMSGFIAIPFMIWRFLVNDVIMGSTFLSISALVLIGAFFLDKSYEDIELRFIYSMDATERRKLHLFASRIVSNVGSAPSRPNDGEAGLTASEMKSRAAVDATLATALSGSLPHLVSSNIILLIFTCLTIAALFFFSFVLYFHRLFSHRKWRRLLNTAQGIRVTYTAAGFGLVNTGISLFGQGWWWLLGLILTITGLLLLGAGMGSNMGMFLKSLSRKVRRK